MNSGHNLLDGIPKSVVFVKEYAQKQIDQGIDIAYWTEARDWCASVPDMTIKDNYFKYDAYLSNTNAYQYNPDQILQGPSERFGCDEFVSVSFHILQWSILITTFQYPGVKPQPSNGKDQDTITGYLGKA